MTEYKLIDSSIWIRYLINEEYKDIIESEGILYLSSFSIFEIKKASKIRLQRAGYIEES